MANVSETAFWNVTNDLRDRITKLEVKFEAMEAARQAAPVAPLGAPIGNTPPESPEELLGALKTGVSLLQGLGSEAEDLFTSDDDDDDDDDQEEVA